MQNIIVIATPDSPPAVPLFETALPIREVTDTQVDRQPSRVNASPRYIHSNLIKLHFNPDMTWHVANSDTVMTIYDERVSDYDKKGCNPQVNNNIS